MPFRSKFMSNCTCTWRCNKTLYMLTRRQDYIWYCLISMDIDLFYISKHRTWNIALKHLIFDNEISKHRFFPSCYIERFELFDIDISNFRYWYIEFRYWYTSWFKMKDSNLRRVGSSRRFLEIDPAMLHTCSIAPVNHVCVIFFAIYFFVCLFCDIGALRPLFIWYFFF